MLENSVSDIVSLLSSDKFEKVELIANGKQEIVDVYPAHCLEADLRRLNILRRNEDLDQDFIDFLEISHDLDNMIMIRKLKRCINDIRKSKYFKMYGTEKRNYKPKFIKRLMHEDKDKEELEQKEEMKKSDGDKEQYDEEKVKKIKRATRKISLNIIKEELNINLNSLG